jgi:hypothetical protein
MSGSHDIVGSDENANNVDPKILYKKKSGVY